MGGKDDLKDTLGRKIGYLRLTSLDNDRVVQHSALKTAGCYCIFEDSGLAQRKEFPGLTALLESLNDGDTLIVWRLDHLDMATREFVLLLDRFKQRRINLISLADKVDTTTSAGKSMLHIGTVMAQMERRVAAERDVRLIGTLPNMRGRPSVLSDDMLKTIEHLLADPKLTTIDIVKRVGLSRATVYRAINILRAKSAASRSDEAAASVEMQ